MYNINQCVYRQNYLTAINFIGIEQNLDKPYVLLYLVNFKKIIPALLYPARILDEWDSANYTNLLQRADGLANMIGVFTKRVVQTRLSRVKIIIAEQ